MIKPPFVLLQLVTSYRLRLYSKLPPDLISFTHDADIQRVMRCMTWNINVVLLWPNFLRKSFCQFITKRWHVLWSERFAVIAAAFDSTLNRLFFGLSGHHILVIFEIVVLIGLHRSLSILEAKPSYQHNFPMFTIFRPKTRSGHPTVCDHLAIHRMQRHGVLDTNHWWG